MQRKFTKAAASLLSAGLLWGSLAGSLWASAPSTAAAASAAASSASVKTGAPILSDVQQHWAQADIERWSSRGIIAGNAAGQFEPDRAVTRAEWVAMLNRIFQLPAGQTSSFKDVQAGKWYAADVTSAVYGGYIQGYSDGTFKPDATLTRAQAAVTVARVLDLPAASAPAFADQASIKAWSDKEIGAVAAQGLLKGYADRTFRPDQPLTRAEAVVLADRAVQAYGSWYGEAGTFGPAEGVQKEAGSVIINAPGVTLRNLDIQGDLIIGKNVGEGDVYLKSVHVKGQVRVYGGGDHSVHLQDSVVVKIIVDKKNGSVRLVAEGASSIQEIAVNTGAELDVSKGVKVDRVVLTDQLPPSSSVSLKGYFNLVDVEAYSLAIKIPEGSIQNLNVGKEAGGTTIDTSKEATILSLALNAAAKVIGLGTIENSVVNAAGVSFETKPKSVTVGADVPADVKISVGGSEQTAKNASPAPTATPTAAGSGGGGVSVQPTATPTPANPDTEEPGGLPWSNRNYTYQIHPEKQYLTVTEAVYFTADTDMDVYFASTGMSSEQDTLELAVTAGKAVKQTVKAGERSYFDIPNLQNVLSGTHDYDYALVGYTGTSYTGYARLTIVDEEQALSKYPVGLMAHTKPPYFGFEYNRLIALAPGQSLEGIVQFALGDGEFRTLDSSLGVVGIVGNMVYFQMNEGVIPERTNFSVRLVQGAVVTADGQLNSERTTPWRLPARVNLITPVPEEGQYKVVIKAGDKLTFSISDTTDVYLLPTFIYGTKKDMDKKVEEHYGLKLTVSEEQVNQPLTMDTTGLAPGEYKLSAWSGDTVYIEITE